MRDQVDLDKLEALLAAATEGPWLASEDIEGQSWTVFSPPNVDENVCTSSAASDAEAIAALRNAADRIAATELESMLEHAYLLGLEHGRKNR